MSDTRAKVETLIAALRLEDAAHAEKSRLLHAELDAVLGGKATVSDHLREIETCFATVWQQRYGTAYMWNYAKDRAQEKRLLKGLEPAEICARVKSYINDDSPIYVKARHAFALFVATINSHAGQPKANGPTEADATADYLQRMTNG